MIKCAHVDVRCSQTCSKAQSSCISHSGCSGPVSTRGRVSVGRVARGFSPKLCFNLSLVSLLSNEVGRSNNDLGTRACSSLRVLFLRVTEKEMHVTLCLSYIKSYTNLEETNYEVACYLNQNLKQYAK